MDVNEYAPGTPSWIDLGSPDIAGSAEFYSALFGWTVEEPTEEGVDYRMCTLGGRLVAGLGAQMNPGPPYWTTYISVADADATAAAVESAGGQILMAPTDVMTAGRMAVFTDQAGAAFSIWQPRDHVGCGTVNEPGTLSWNELQTRDLDGSKAFYGEVFGWGEVTHDGDMPYTEYQLGENSIAGMAPIHPDVPNEVPSAWMIYFAVEDCEATVARVTELGGAVLVAPMDIPQGRFSVVTDPQQAVFQIIALADS